MFLKELKMSYKSKFEEQLAKDLGKKAEYEPDKLKFIQPAKQRNYIPDFKIIKSGIYIEAKGKLTFEDREKMLWVKEQYPDKDIRILFMNASNRIRKGSPTTYGDWATKNGFIWADYKTQGIPKEWIK